MSQNSYIKHIIIIDKMPHWRKFSKEALAQRGYAVHQQEAYDYPPPIVQKQEPALVILGCAVVGQEERELIDKIVTYDHHLIVFCTALSRSVMRSLFLTGADDIASRSFDVDEFVEIIEQVLESIEERNIYQKYG